MTGLIIFMREDIITEGHGATDIIIIRDANSNMDVSIDMDVFIGTDATTTMATGLTEETTKKTEGIIEEILKKTEGIIEGTTEETEMSAEDKSFCGI